MSLNLIKRTVLECVLTYIVFMILSWLIIDRVIIKHSEMILVSSIVLVISKYLYENTKKYIIAMIIIIFSIMSPIIIKLLIGENIYLDSINRYLGFFISILNLIFILGYYIKLNHINLIIVSLLLVAIFLPIFTLWGYYFSTSTWLGVDAILAIMQTNFNEALGYLTEHFNIIDSLILFLSIFFIFIWSYFFCSIKKNKHRKVLTLLLIIIDIFLIYKCHFNLITNLYYDTSVYVDKYQEFNKNKELRKEQIDKNFVIENKDNKGIFVLVIGESQNKNHFSKYGYQRETTPWLDSMKSKNMLIFDKAYACYTHTVPALTYALTAKNQYNDLVLEKSVSLLEVAEKAGFETVWISNQVQYGAFDTPISIIADEANQQKWINNTVGAKVDINFYDEKLVEEIDNINITDKMLIVIHLMGSHAPYEDRYPSNFAKFGIVNKVDRYDNSILYTDYVMSLIFEKVKNMPNFKGMIYFSDHSEAVDQGLEHDANNFVYDMVEIPMYIYLSDEYIQSYSNKFDNIQKAQKYLFTNDLIFNTVLGVMDINIENMYEVENDITNKKYDYKSNRFKTMYNKKDIIVSN